MPKAIPVSRLPVSGIRIIVKTAGTASIGLSKPTSFITFIISTPETISVVAVAADGTKPASGAETEVEEVPDPDNEAGEAAEKDQ